MRRSFRSRVRSTTYIDGLEVSHRVLAQEVEGNRVIADLKVLHSQRAAADSVRLILWKGAAQQHVRKPQARAGACYHDAALHPRTSSFSLPTRNASTSITHMAVPICLRVTREWERT